MMKRNVTEGSANLNGLITALPRHSIASTKFNQLNWRSAICDGYGGTMPGHAVLTGVEDGDLSARGRCI